MKPTSLEIIKLFCDNDSSLEMLTNQLSPIPSQAAYLVGVSDPASEPGRPGVVDHSQFSRANQAIQMACQNLSNPASSQQQVSNAHGVKVNLLASG